MELLLIGLPFVYILITVPRLAMASPHPHCHKYCLRVPEVKLYPGDLQTVGEGLTTLPIVHPLSTARSPTITVK